MMRIKLSRFAITGFLLVVTVAGCADATKTPQPVSGTVTIKGGKTVPRGTIRFTSLDKKASGSGDIDELGEYKISSLAANDGVPAGEYTVTLSGTQQGGGYDHPNEKVVEIVHAKYSNDKDSDLKVTVKPGKNVIPIEVDPPAK